jgi:hypothetical protein
MGVDTLEAAPFEPGIAPLEPGRPSASPLPSLP